MKKKPYETIDQFTWRNKYGQPATDREKKKDREARILMMYGAPFAPGDVLKHHNLDDDYAAAQEVAKQIEMVGRMGIKIGHFSPVWTCNPVRIAEIMQRFGVTKWQAIDAAKRAGNACCLVVDSFIKEVLAEEAARQEARKAESEQPPEDYENLV